MNEKRLIIGSKTKLPPTVTNWAESHKAQAGVYSTWYRGKRIYLVATGEKPTGGFRLVTTLAEGRGDTVHYHLESPSPDDFVIQILTYPYEIIVVKDGSTLHFYSQCNGELKSVLSQETTPLSD